MNYDFGKQIYQLRRRRKLSQAALADAMGNATQSDISAWERCADYPSEEQLTALCKAFDVDKEFLVGSNHEGAPLSAMENDLLQRFRILAQYNQRRLFRFADNLLVLQRDEQAVQHEERMIEREAEKKLYPEGREKIRCSFCGKPQSLCERLIAGNGAYICEECIGLCTDILNDNFDPDEKQ